MITTAKALIAVTGALPILNFQFGQFPKFFQSGDFFLLVSQLLNQIFSGIAQGLIAIFVDGALGVTA